MFPSPTPPFQNPQTFPGDPKATMPGFAPSPQQPGFGFPQGQQPGFGFPQGQQPSPYPGAAGYGAPQGGFGNMQNRPSSTLTQQFASGGQVQGNAQQVQQYGRGNDTMLMHVTPGEVQGLQALAQQHGGTLTTNPHTGLPEAGFLESILPMLAGGLLTLIPGVGPLMAAGLVGGGTGIATGDLGKGLMAGLGAFGGGSLAGALGGMGAAGAGQAAAADPALLGAATNAANPALAGAAIDAGMTGTLATAPTAIGGAAGVAPGVSTAINGVGANAASTLGSQAVPGLAANIPGAAQPGMLQSMLGQNMGDKVAGFGRDFAEAASGGAKISPMRTGLAALGASTPVLEAMQPKYETYKEDEGFNYEGPYTPTQRNARFRGPNANFGDSSEFSYFDNTNPYPGFEPAPKGYAEGGDVAPEADRELRMPAADYRAGMGAEHNYNFQPVNPAPGMQPVHFDAKGNNRQSIAGLFAAAAGKGRKLTEDDAMHAQGMRRFRYDPRTQSVVDDGSYNSMSDTGGSGALGGPSLFSSGVNIDSLKNLSTVGGTGTRFAGGGDVNLRDGSFVVDARTVSELGNGSSSAGQELLARHGGQPISGPGDGVSDSIPANIGGRQRAKVARDEVKFDPEAVRRIGGGNPQRGAQKLYALMEKAQKARKAAGRGQDTKLRKALSK